MAYQYIDFKGLNGAKINLRSMAAADIPSMRSALMSPTTWFCVNRDLGTTERFDAGMLNLLEKQKRGDYLAVVARLNTTKEVVALSTYHDADPGFLRVEIGFTWVADAWQRTFVNTELKLLMLKHAFDDMKVVRVQFAVDPTNTKSNQAMVRIGAKLEGTLRKWRFLSSTDKGDRNIYSILDNEWPQVRERLEESLTRHNTRSNT